MDPEQIEIRPVGAAERTWMESVRNELFHGEIIVSRGRVHRPLELPGFVACVGSEPVGAAIFEIRRSECELVSLDARRRWKGIGTALLEAVESAARANGCATVWLITTNDNTDALRFYQRRGYGLTAVFPGAIAESRKVKPTIPEIGNHDIPIRDEIRLEKRLDPL